MNQATRKLRIGRCWPATFAVLLGTTLAAGIAQAEPFSLSGGYMGLNVGKPSYKTDCGTSSAYRCDDPSASFNLYGGAMFNEYLGAEVGYVNMGNADRGGGRTSAQGLNFSLVGRVPLGDSRFSAFAKGGATYGRTKVDAETGSGIATGHETGWGGAYGAGVGYALNPTSSVVLEWQRHDFRFIDTGREGVETTSIGFVKRF